MADINVKLAVLIDADNAMPSVANALLTEVAKYGTSFVRRAYGDWTVRKGILDIQKHLNRMEGS
jgi:hypothetical protein